MSNQRRHLPSSGLLALSLVAVAVNFRTAIASVPPLVQAIGADLGLSNAALGALTTLPVLCMGVFAPAAQKVAGRLGAAAAIESAMVCMVVGLALRLAGAHVWALY